MLFVFDICPKKSQTPNRAVWNLGFGTSIALGVIPLGLAATAVYWFIVNKNSSLFLVCLMRCSMNSIASTGFISAKYLRRIHMR
ncbi:hypothetical protein SAMN05421636_105366 [Pricia antarctica]|uniref:Uncharacterized protein n=1 Tax=Pricia antarctica TaxID=641691 RepID=A0A1G7DKG9_9FLAO|nr:hypothetical protein SAMN05421636_105366 [Pricia antarctica]